MKILLFTDNHFCENSSIIRKFGTKYSLRIENQLESINWLERLAVEKECDEVICLGDFFDKPNLTDAELTAIRDIEWNNLPHYFLVGNHESSVNGLSTSSTKALENYAAKRYVISEPTIWKYNNDENEICFLPYIIESDRKPISDYFGRKLGSRIVLSHNDIKGIQMGPVESKTGFEIKDIESSCDLFLNGHLHNGTKFCKNGLNLGNLTGQNFGEDATRYNHNVLILDTETRKVEFIENPYAFNFYKLEINTKADLKVLNNLKNNSILSIKCRDVLVNEVKDILGSLTNVIESRIVITKDVLATDVVVDMSDFSVDHIAKFIECARNHYGNDPVLEAELAEICK